MDFVRFLENYLTLNQTDLKAGWEYQHWYPKEIAKVMMADNGAMT